MTFTVLCILLIVIDEGRTYGAFGFGSSSVFTTSYIPACLQTFSHFTEQLSSSEEMHYSFIIPDAEGYTADYSVVVVEAVRGADKQIKSQDDIGKLNHEVQQLNTNSTEETVTILEEEKLKMLQIEVEQVVKNQTRPLLSVSSLNTLNELLTKYGWEAERQGLSKYQGYSNQMLLELSETSSKTSREQLLILLQKATIQRDLRRRDSKALTNQVIRELKQDQSQLSKDLLYVRPLVFLAK